MRDLKFIVRMCAAFVAIVLLLGVAQKWDGEQTDHVRAVLASNT